MSRFLMALSLLVSFEVIAQQSAEAPPFRYGYKDWILREESVDPYLGVPSCRAYTTKASPEAPVQLSLSFPKDYLKAPVAMISLGPSLKGQKLEIKLISEGAELALPLDHLTTPEGTTYWYVPVAMDQFIHTINHAETLDLVVLAENQSEEVKISLAGSLRTLQVATRCLGQPDLYLSRFFDELNDQSVEAVTVEGDISPRKLEEFFQMSYAFFASLKKVQADLDLLAEQNKDALAEEGLAQQAYNQARQELTQTQNTLKSGEEETTRLRDLLSTSNAELEKVKEQRKRDEEELQRITNLFSPLQTQLTEYQQQIAKERSRIDVLKGHIRYEEMGIKRASEGIVRLQEELKERQNQVQAWNKELASYREERAQAENELNALNVELEARQRLEGHPRYQAAGAEIQKLRVQLAPMEEKMRQAQGVQIQAQRAFETCRRANLEDPTGLCGNEINQLQSAQGAFSLKQREVREVNTRITQFEVEISNLRQSIRQNVLDERDQILHRFNTAKQNVARVETLIKNSENRIEHVGSFEIPHLQKEIASSENKLKELRTQESNAQNRLSSLQTSLETFRISSNYDQIHLERSSAQQALRDTLNREKNLETTLADSEKRLAAIAAERPQLEAVLRERTSVLNQATTNLRERQSGLRAYRTEEGRLKQTLELLTRQYKESRGHYRFLLSELAN